MRNNEITVNFSVKKRLLLIVLGGVLTILLGIFSFTSAYQSIGVPYIYIFDAVFCIWSIVYFNYLVKSRTALHNFLNFIPLAFGLFQFGREFYHIYVTAAESVNSAVMLESFSYAVYHLAIGIFITLFAFVLDAIKKK